MRLSLAKLCRWIVNLGYSRKIYGGHCTVPIAPPKPGYHGENGYRRNTPSLRYKPSPFDIEGSYY